MAPPSARPIPGNEVAIFGVIDDLFRQDAEVIYGITVSVGDVVPENQHHPILFIEIPRLAFPFARQIMATMTSQGGYPPVLLNPVDFQALYMERFKDNIEAAQKTSANGKTN